MKFSIVSKCQYNLQHEIEKEREYRYNIQHATERERIKVPQINATPKNYNLVATIWSFEPDGLFATLFLEQISRCHFSFPPQVNFRLVRRPKVQSLSFDICTNVCLQIRINWLWRGRQRRTLTVRTRFALVSSRAAWSARRFFRFLLVLRAVSFKNRFGYELARPSSHRDSCADHRHWPSSLTAGGDSSGTRTSQWKLRHGRRNADNRMSVAQGIIAALSMRGNGRDQYGISREKARPITIEEAKRRIVPHNFSTR